MAKSTFKWNQAGLNNLNRGITKGLLNIGAAIAKQARTNAPVDTGALKGSIRVAEKNATTVYVLAGGNVGGKSIPYALRREYENNLHPDKKHYMRNAVKTVANSDIKQYFKDIK